MNTITVNDGLSSWEINGNEAIQAHLKSVLGGRFFSVTFNKKNGEERVINGSFNMEKLINGNGSPRPENIVPVYDRKTLAIRSFDIERLKSIECGNIVITGMAA